MIVGATTDRPDLRPRWPALCDELSALQISDRRASTRRGDATSPAIAQLFNITENADIAPDKTPRIFFTAGVTAPN